MTDARLSFGDCGPDLSLESGDLLQDAGLGTAVLLSLLTDAEATPQELERMGGTNRRGWWADPRAGSKLWLLEREKVTNETAERAREYVRDALAWLVEDGIAQSVDVSASWESGGRLSLRVEIRRGRAAAWDHVWKGTLAESYQSDRIQLEITGG